MYNELPDHERALTILKTEGPQSVKQLARQLNITVEGARFHLVKLEKDALVKSESVAEGRGRPKQIWSLTKKGHDRFPDTHAALTVNLIDMMRDTLGDEALDRVIDEHEERTLDRYRQEMEGTDLEERVAELVEIRSREGYMAEYHKEGEDFIFVENHCPICSAAKVCQGFCRAEINVFRVVLGEDVQIERTEHIIAGARRCAYRISSS
jgi:predicted ArsR family transcriptional regulator